jgi:hypothetical protein
MERHGTVRDNVAFEILPNIAGFEQALAGCSHLLAAYASFAWPALTTFGLDRHPLASRGYLWPGRCTWPATLTVLGQ